MAGNWLDLNFTGGSGGGGSTSPAGSDTQIQYNNSGAFGASANFTYNQANNAIVFPSSLGLNGQVNFSQGYARPALVLYEGGTGSNYGWGLQSQNMQFYIPSTAVYTWCKAGDFQSTGSNELLRLDASTGRLGIGATSPQAALDTGTGRITGGTNSSGQRIYLDLSSQPTFPAADIILPAGGIFRTVEYSLLGTNDVFFQAMPATSSGYGYLEAYLSAGLVLGTGGNGSPVIFAPNRVEAARITASGMTVNPTLTTLSGRVVKTRSVTAAGAITVATTDYYIGVNKTVGAATAVNLPASPVTGTTFIIKDEKGDALVNNITVTPAAGNIDNAATYVMNINKQSITVIYNGTQWTANN